MLENGEVRAVPFKRYNRPGLCYLDKPEIDALLATPDRTTEQGRRDHGVLLFLYNTGARASEAATVDSVASPAHRVQVRIFADYR